MMSLYSSCLVISSDLDTELSELNDLLCAKIRMYASYQPYYSDHLFIISKFL